jgi:hypothetical protein
MEKTMTRSLRKPRLVRPALVAACWLAASAAQAVDQSEGWYRIPFANGTEVKIANDHLTHSPKTRIDMVGKEGDTPYKIVAAAPGTVRFVVDKFSENRPDGNPCNNNYVWIEHANGEWTKYSHVKHNSASKTAGIKAGQQVSAGTFLGYQGDVGCAHGAHLHWEVAVPTDSKDPIDDQGFIKGINRIPKVCGAKNALYVKGESYIARDLRHGAKEVAYHGVSADRYQDLFDSVTGCGYHVDWIDGFSKGGDAYFNVVFRPNVAGRSYASFHGMNGDQYQAKFDEWVGQHKFRLTHVDVYNVGDKLRYAAVFESGSGPAYVAYHGIDTATHQQRFNDLTKQGYVPTVLSVASVDGKRHFAGIYVKQSVGAFEAQQAMSGAQYQAEFDSNAKAGRHLSYLNAYVHDGKPQFTAIWVAQPAASVLAKHGLNSDQYHDQWASALGSGWLTQAITGYVDGGQVRYAAFWGK